MWDVLGYYYCTWTFRQTVMKEKFQMEYAKWEGIVMGLCVFMQ